jgi:arylsulfatase
MIDPGQVDGEWHSSLDILPSLVALCGLGLPEKPLDGVDMSGILGGREKNAAVEQKSRLYFSPMGKKGLELHCIRKRNWKLRVAQGIEGEIYTNDRTTSAKDSAWLQHPHPEIVAELTREIETLMPTFPPDVVQAYAELQQNKGDISTPPGASPRPFGARLSPGSWEPQDRR